MSQFTFKGTLSQAKSIQASWLKTINECENRIDNLYIRLTAVESFIDNEEEKSRVANHTHSAGVDMINRSNIGFTHSG